MDIALDLLKAFAVGGGICVIGQLLIDFTKMTPGKVLVLFVVLGVVLGALGIYEPLVDFAGSGATTPIIGFGYSLAKGVVKAINEKGFIGVLTGGVIATAGGISAAVFFGLLFSLISKPKAKNPKR